MFGYAPDTTNNRMEMTAVIEALRSLERPVPTRVHTDSQYVMKGVTEWMRGWKARGWLTADRKPVKNVDQWKALETLLQPHTVQWRWVRGHTGDPGNEQADRLANQGVEQARAGSRVNL